MIEREVRMTLAAYEEKSHEESTKLMGIHAAEIEAHDAFLNSSISVTHAFNALAESVAVSINIVPKKLSVSEYHAKAVDVMQMPWAELAEIIQHKILHNPHKNLFKDPLEWPDNVKSYFKKEVERELAAVNLEILDQSKYLATETSYSEDMLGIFKTKEQLEAHLLIDLSLGAQPTVRGPRS